MDYCLMERRERPRRLQALTCWAVTAAMGTAAREWKLAWAIAENHP